MIGCVFCDIVTERAPAKILASWPDAMAIEPLNPVVPGHVLVIPHAHVRSFIEDPFVTASVMARASKFAARLGMPGEGVNLITSAGEAATQTVFHLHVHLVPRYLGDGLALPWTGQHD
jgi:histidine triad (HIT) family protein